MVEALTDPLTGLANRRKFDQELARRFAQWKGDRNSPVAGPGRRRQNFKKVNDLHGTSPATPCLQQVAQVLLESVRANDLVARYGGEEFGVILPGTSLEEAKPVAERVRGAITEHGFQFGDTDAHVTVSAGLGRSHAHQRQRGAGHARRHGVVLGQGTPDATVATSTTARTAWPCRSRRAGPPQI